MNDKPNVRYQRGGNLFSVIGVSLLRFEECEQQTKNLDGSTLIEPGFLVRQMAKPNEPEFWISKAQARAGALSVGHFDPANPTRGPLNVSAVTPEMVGSMIADHKTTRLDEKTTLVSVTLVNGYKIHETSSCVDPLRYNQAIGERLCFEKIEKKIFELLGFLLQTARFGLDYVKPHDAPAQAEPSEPSNGQCSNGAAAETNKERMERIRATLADSN